MKHTENPLDAGNYIRTFSGIYINVFDPDPDDIEIEDIAHALANQCRFAGQCKRHYSVATHCMYISTLLPNELKFEGLMHDASEAYLVDMPSPIKAGLPQYKEIEHNLMTMIAKKFNFSWPVHELVHKADRRGLEFEWENNVINDNMKNFTMTPKYAKLRFLELFELYSKLPR